MCNNSMKAKRKEIEGWTTDKTEVVECEGEDRQRTDMRVGKSC